MRRLFFALICCLMAATTFAVDRQYFTVGDSRFNKNGNNNTADAATNSFTIGNSFGTVFWQLGGMNINNYQFLVVKIKKVTGNNLRLVITDTKGVDYNHKVGVDVLDGPQEIIVDLFRTLTNDNGTSELDKGNISRITFWNYWDNGDGIEAASVEMDQMYLEPYASGTHIGNPIVQTNYTSDPAPMVYGDRLYVFTGHDEDNASYYEMNDWRVYSTADMVNWTDHGAPIDWSVYPWCKGAAWAAQPVERNGKIYFYTSSEHRDYGFHVVGVAVADKPEGPYKPGGNNSLTRQFGDIDPTVFIDNDGQAYVYYGNNALRYITLKNDMVTVKSGPTEIPLTAQAFGGVKVDGKVQGADCYEEGPWFYRRGDKYYLVYAAGGIPEHISYSMADSPKGPWTYKGIIMPAQGGSFTNHPGVIEFKGHSYLAYHNGALPGGGGFDRSVAFEEFTYNADGTIPTINMTSTGVAPIGALNPYAPTEAETIAWSYGLKTKEEPETGVYVTNIDQGDYLSVREADFGEHGATSIKIRARGLSGGRIRVHIDSPKAKQTAYIDVPASTDWAEYEAELNKVVTGKHDVWFTFRGNNVMDFDRWQFIDPDNVGVENVSADPEADQEEVYYNLQGVRLANPKGLVITSKGKKLFIP